MEWSKAKNLIILLLAAVNLFLLCNFLYLVHKNRVFVNNTVSDLTQYLDSCGIDLDGDRLPLENPGRTVLVVERDAGRETAVAAALLQDPDPAVDGEGSYAAADGEVVIRFGGYLTARFASPPDREALSELLTQAGVSFLPEETEDGGFQLTFGELPVYNCRLTLGEGEDAGVLTGRICVGNVLRTDSEQERDAAGLLVGVAQQLVQSGVTRIGDVGSGWIAGSISNVGLRLTPAYRLDTDAGEFFVNAVDGTLMTAE